MVFKAFFPCKKTGFRKKNAYRWMTCSGTLSRKQIDMVFEVHSIGYSSNQLLFLKLERINLLHQRCDIDGDGVLNFQEFKRSALSTMILYALVCVRFSNLCSFCKGKDFGVPEPPVP